ncbi:recombinase family protein [Mycobacterium intracellulare]|uniref:recombinase family protein n=1 Tax=Mycobacterium intracellulare TaxID=1767 RepID=UPI0019164662|nr:recombinase family protein [Mycobacterium intracellulare]MCA2356759.1 recombinase family protein [Mycobacterium intracellulare]MCA2367677.1 recombinase family protein [Mycobacterium intracellulare]
MASTSRTRRAAVYLRISLDHTGEGLAVARQREQCQQIIEQRGWTAVAEFVDNSISASDARKNRPGYDALVKAYETGQFDALVTYDLDRLTRQPRQLEDWVEAAEGKGLALVTANGEADLTTDAGRLFARIKMAVARSEVERKSARQKVAAMQRADLGRPPLGVRLTGYTPKGETVPDEAELVRRIFKMFDSGESLRSIARTLTNEGVTARSGKPWNPSSIRETLTNPRYAGRAIYCGQPTGKRGNWEALVSEDAFDGVQARLTDPRRATNRVGTDRRHLGSGLYICDACGEPVVSFSGGRYRCKAACVNRAHGPVDNDRVRCIIAADETDAPPAHGVDEFVTAVVAERLSRADAAALAEAPQADTAPLRAEIADLRARLVSFDNDYAEGEISGKLYREATAKVHAKLAEAERKVAAMHPGGSALGDVLASPDPVAAFLSASLMGRRSVIDALCEVRLRRGTRGSKTFDPNTVRIEWRR